MSILEGMKPDRIELWMLESPTFALSVMLGSFADAAQLVNLIAWCREHPEAEVERVVVEGNRFEVRLASAETDHETGDEKEARS